MTKLLLALATISLSLNSPAASAGWLVKERVHAAPEQRRESLQVTHVAREPRSGIAKETLTSTPWAVAEHLPPSKDLYEETLYAQDALPMRLRAAAKAPVPKLENAELITLVNQGDPENRICLTILGDGYTQDERDKFVADAKRMTDNLFTTSTFASYLPLFNVYAVFVPSHESGITDLVEKDTAFSLYRYPPGSKMAIIPGNPSAIEAALQSAPKTDYPVVIANDEYYGGLGGRYAITTRSVESGAIVLRHELGHNFGAVGEEYDGAQTYYGANHSSSVTYLKWPHWVNSPGTAHDMRLLSGEYVWTNLSSGAFTTTFEFPANGTQGPWWFEILLSSVGWQTPDDVSVFLDGQPVRYTGRYTDDRSFFQVERTQSLAPGTHRLEIRENIHDGNNVLAFAQVYAYERTYDFSGAIGAFPTHASPGQRSGFRPTHSACLMRDMTVSNFCSVDLENMWVRFLDRVRLVDEVTVSSSEVSLHAQNFPSLQIRWFKLDAMGRETELTDFAGLRKFPRPKSMTGPHRVRVKFETPEVRRYTPRFEQAVDFQAP
jgi:hypothetical protein